MFPRRHSKIREVDVEVIAPDDTPFVMRLLSTGELPGVNADPRTDAVDMTEHSAPEPPTEPVVAPPEPEPEEPEPQQFEAVDVPKHDTPEPATEPVAAPPEPEPPPVDPAPLPPAAETPSTSVPRRAAKRKRRPPRPHPPQRLVAPAPAPPAVPTEVSEPAPPPEAEATCEIRFWRGYLKANFYACVFGHDGQPLAVAESPFFRAHGNGIPDKTEEAVAAYDALRQRLELSGWEHAAPGRTWYGDLYSLPF
jgi:hypothetical protein